ncbi:hypothetical protein ACSBR2_005757 [Camellia fascicularis]
MDDPRKPSSSSSEPNKDATMVDEDDESSSATVLDLTSFQLHDLDSVELPPSLTELDLTANRLSTLDLRIAHLSNLKKLSLRQNLFHDAGIDPISGWHEISDLEVMENLQNFTNLQELWLGRNRIRAINLCGLKCIKKISLQSNRLTSMAGLEECIALEELYMSHNGIAKMEGLSTLINLRVLDVSSNKLTAIDDIKNLPRLEDLWLNDNQITSLEDIAEAVAGSRDKLTTIYLERNSCAKSPNYMTTVRQVFPNIQQIDSEVFA